jgi:DNA repair protein SbcC/Rad50
MIPMLKSITITNFRSIKGSTTVPLDAPVVLIHGQNGTGKTSLLSAIEFGLTGHVPSLSRLDSDYVSHLVHKDAREARVMVSADAVNGGRESAEVTVRRTEISGSPLLAQSRAHFYSERCYLAQATLGRLLELYEDKDARKSDSPLTKFVKDLLGLDQLDALIDGLHDAGNVRRFRSTLPVYWDIRERISALTSTLTTERAELLRLDDQLRQIDERLRDRLVKLNIDVSAELAGTSILPGLRDQPEEQELQRLAALRRDIIAAREQWKIIQSSVTSAERDAAEKLMASANEALKGWRSTTGHEFEVLFGRLKAFFADLPSPLSSGPEKARTAAVQLVNAELERCTTLLTRDESDTKRLAALDQDIERARARSGVLDQQIAGHAANASSLAQALAGIMPHIHSDECPVCGRDFSEQSSQPLQAHLAAKIATLTESGGRLQALTRERAEASKVLSAADRERGVVAGRLLTPTDRDELRSRRAQLEDILRSLVHLAAASVTGEQVIKAAAAATRGLNELRSRDQRATSFRETAVRFADQLRLAPVDQAEGFEPALQRFQAVVTEREKTLLSQQTTRREAIADLRERQSVSEMRIGIINTIHSRELELERLTKAKEIADDRIAQARELANRARQVRTNVVRRVFNDSLNSLWRDLFVRLAPDEPFVPAFALPDKQTGPVEAVLETLYRAGGRGGNPRAMLSAGNLNTAALTLFLALHLSVKPMLPFLVIDDPVQSMDEVHVAQFAALLRTLSKQHGRQVIVAVHEKPLFDYLSLELSPAFPNDRLITIELRRSASGETTHDYVPLVWKPDPAIAA